MQSLSLNSSRVGWMFLLAALLAAPAASGQTEMEPAGTGGAKRAVLYRLEGQLTQTMITSLNRAISTAKENGAGTLIIEINTPGGEIGLMEQLRDLVFDAYHEDKLDTVAFINKNADSAGALIAMACRTLTMAPLGHIGSATPVVISPPIPFGQPGMPLVDPDMMNKVKSRTLAIFRATATEAGRNPHVAEAMVDPDIELVLARINDEERVTTREKFIDEQARLGKAAVEELDVICEADDLLNITADEALAIGFIDGIFQSRSELITGFLEVPKENVVIISRTWSEGLVDFIDSIHWLLLVAGLVFLYIEFKIPGFGVPGIVGASCLAILFFGQYMAGMAEIIEILLIILGLALVAVEIFVIPGTFIPGGIGVVLIVVGALLSFQPFLVPRSPWDVEMLEDNVVSMGFSLLSVAGIALILTRFLPKTSFFRRLALNTGVRPGALAGSAMTIDDVHPEQSVAVGDIGKALNELHPVGKIVIDNSTLDAQSEGEYITKGDPVRIVRVTGNFIFVRKAEDKAT